MSVASALCGGSLVVQVSGSKEGTKKQVLLLAAIFLTFVVSNTGEAFGKAAPQLSADEIQEAEQRLWDLGYWAGQIDGRFDSASRHGLIAFQKVERRARTGKLTAQELNALRSASRPIPRYTRDPHVEIDLERQVLFVIGEDGLVMRILPVSTGNGELYVDHGQVHRAHTPTGTFKVQRKIEGWRISSLGMLYYPSYIVNGIAVHGSLSIPTRPASHGCIRVPMFAAKELSALMPIGMEVFIYHDTGTRT